MVEKVNKKNELFFDLPKIEDSRGNLSFIEEDLSIPFPIARVYWIYDVPCGQTRGSHAFKTQEEIIIAISGSFDVVLHDGERETRYQLNRAYKALYIPARTWRTLENFATNSVCLVISSGKYDKEEYITNFKKFRQYLKMSSIPNPLVRKNEERIQSDQDLAYNNVSDCSLIELPKIVNRAGNLTPVHNSVDIPFDVKRIFFVYDIPFGKTRGMHAHKHCHELILAVSGSFDVELEDGQNKRTVHLNRPSAGIYVLPGIWTKETNYSSGSVCLVLTSQKYSEEDYIRKYSDFKILYGDRDKKI